MNPAFSIPPAPKSGTATRSSFSYGNSMPKYFASSGTISEAACNVIDESAPRPFVVMKRIGGVCGARLTTSKCPSGERNEIRRQRRRRVERDGRHAVVIDFVFLGAVRKRDHPRRNRELHVERRFESRFVEARKRAARVRGFELRERVRLAAIARGVETCELFSERRIERDRDRRVTFWKNAIRRQHELVGREGAFADGRIDASEVERPRRRLSPLRGFHVHDRAR